MAETHEQPAHEPAGAPGTELGLAAGNVLAFGLTLLGGLWVWLALALAVGGAGAVAWRVQRRRTRRRDGQGQASGRRGASGLRSPGLSGLGRAGGRRSGSGRGTGGAPGTGPGRRTGRGTGRGTAAASGPGTAPKRTGKGALAGLFGRGKGSGRSPRSGADGGRPARSRGAKGAGRRVPAWLKGLGARGRGAGTGRSLNGPTKAGPGSAAPSRKSTRRGRTRRPRRRPPAKGDLINTPNPKKASTTPAPKATKPTARPSPKTTDDKPQPEQQAQPQKPAVPHPYRSPGTTAGHTTKENIMASVFGKRWRQNAEEIHIQALRYDPEKMPDYLDDLGEMTRAFEEEAKALGKIAAISESELPVDPRLVEYIVQTQATMRKVSEDAGEVVAHFKKLHEQELSRHEQRRRGEEKWNVQ